MSNDLTQIVALDGPAGAGKSTVARRAAERLGFAFLDTGAMYRAATWRALHRGVDLEDPDALAESTRAMHLEMPLDNAAPRVIVDGRDVTEAIRSQEVTRNIYRLDEVPAVRERLVELQRAWASGRPTVAEGRDMGTVVFPEAKCKIFLEASIEVRARRRLRELAERGEAPSLDGLIAEIAERDARSRTRAASPLRQAEDAVLIDTSNMTLDEAAEAVVAEARKRL